MSKPQCDLSDPTVFEAIILSKMRFLAKEKSYMLDIDGRAVPAFRFVHPVNRDEVIIVPFSKRNAIITMPFFKKGEVSDEYVIDVLYAVYHMLDVDRLEADTTHNYVMGRDPFIEICSLSGLMLVNFGECEISGANDLWAIPLPSHLKGSSVKELKEFTSRYMERITSPNVEFFNLPESVINRTSSTTKITH